MNAKSKLKEICDKTRSVVKYTTSRDGLLFSTTVSIRGKSFTGEPMINIRASEHSAAQKMLDDIKPKKAISGQFILWIDDENLPKFYEELKSKINLDNAIIKRFVSNKVSPKNTENLTVINSMAPDAADIAIIMNVAVTLSTCTFPAFVASKDKFAHTLSDVLKGKIKAVCSVDEMLSFLITPNIIE